MAYALHKQQYDQYAYQKRDRAKRPLFKKIIFLEKNRKFFWQEPWRLAEPRLIALDNNLDNNIIFILENIFIYRFEYNSKSMISLGPTRLPMHYPPICITIY